MDDPKFSKFSVTSTPYKTVNGQDIALFTFIPKDITSSSAKAPIIVNFHGGFLISGSGEFPDWTSQWSLEYAIRHSAIIVAPNYRLLPESTGLDVLSDVSDFWEWLASTLPSYLISIGSTVIPDLSKVLVYGGSAGGYLAVQSALLKPSVGIKAVVAAYPMVIVDRPEYSVKSTTRSPNGAPQLPVSIMEDHIKAIVPGKIVSSSFPPDRLQLCVVAVQQGLLTSYIGHDDSLYPLRVLRKFTGDEDMPYLFAYAGKEDSAVPYQETTSLVEEWGKKFGEENALAKIESGDHGFDGSATLETPWLIEGLIEVTKRWLDTKA